MLVAPKYAKRLNPRFAEKFSEITPPWGPVGYVCYKRTYSRMTDAGVTEEWWQTCARCVNGLLEIGAVYTKEEVEQLFYFMFMLKGTPAGRPIWQLGTETVRRLGGDSLNNCFAGDTEVITDQGVVWIKDLVGKKVKVKVFDGNEIIWVETEFVSHGEQKILCVNFVDGGLIKTTATHEWLVYKNGKAHLHGKVHTTDLLLHEVPFITESGNIRSTIVKSIKGYGHVEEVFCCSISDYHNFVLANGIITGNCWVVACNEPVDPFTFTFNELMLGGGVGFNITPEMVYEIPIVKHNIEVKRVDDYDCDYIVTDNREGWVGLLERVLQSFFYTGKNLRYDTRCIRPKGRPISGFGGFASGPEELVKGIGQISNILRSRHGRKLSPTNCLDIFNIIGSVVVSGNIRRSAEIGIGSADDPEFLGAKDWSRHPVPAYRQMANLSVATSDTIHLPEDYWRGYEGNGEAYGLYNQELCRRYGRLIDGEDYRLDLYVIGANPCAEQIMESHEACNLSEQYLPNIDDINEFGQVAELLFKANKAISCLPYWHPKTNEVVKRNRRIGIGITGVLQSPLNDPEIFDAIYSHLEEVDKHVSREMGVNQSIKLTTVKPSGTLSLLAGVSPGGHADFAPFAIRRIMFATDDPIVKVAIDNGYHAEPKINLDGSRDLGAIVIDFPVKSRGGPVASNYSALEQLRDHEMLQTHWSDSSVSKTIYMQPDEIPIVRAWLRENYHDTIKTISFSLHKDHGFKQAPYEEITEEQYLEMIAHCRPIDSITDDKIYEIIDTVECGTGGCPTK